MHRLLGPLYITIYSYTVANGNMCSAWTNQNFASVPPFPALLKFPEVLKGLNPQDKQGCDDDDDDYDSKDDDDVE